MKSQYKWAIAASSALLIGFVSVQQTGALWRDSVEGTGGGTITAGQLNIATGNGVKNFELKNFKLENSGPGASVQMPLPVINSGNVQMSYLLSDVELTNNVNPPPLTLRVAAVANEADCTNTEDDVGRQIYSGTMDGAAFDQPELVQAGEIQVLCLRATMGDSAGANSETGATFTFAASSVSQS